ncbi:MAG: ABC transporter permease subunit [Gammaproteobacteria bacterium]|nr:ABC transporter permease subunit [Pseudomonadales bacterium]MCP5345755.1 ABC transporter permease subunit [Pseudomonadales bacterium]
MSSTPGGQSAAEPTHPSGPPDEELEKSLARQSFRRRLRYFNDQFARVSIAAGGIGVIVAILLIFVYLLLEVIPLFQSADVQQVADYRLEGAADAGLLHLAVEEQSEIGMRLDADAVVTFFRVADGGVIERRQLALPPGATVTGFALASEESGLFALGFSNGTALIARYDFQTRFRQDGTREIIPHIEYPFGEDDFILFEDTPIDRLAISERADVLLLAGVNTAGNTNLIRITQQRNLFSSFNLGGAAPQFEVESLSLSIIVGDVDQLFIDGDQRWMYFITDRGRLSLVDLRPALRGQASSINQVLDLVAEGRRPTRISLLLGDISLLVANNAGIVSQWLLVPDSEGQMSLQRVRSFEVGDSPVIALSPEQRRKNFVVADADGHVGFYNTTAHREAYNEMLFEEAPEALAISPRGDTLLAELGGGEISVWSVHNEHPEVSWSALWSKVWYESYIEPGYIWQSSAANNDFEPKYSLVPLAFGTLKAAFYAMLLATPLAICGAIFTGYFMVPVMRRQVKPLIELMAAMPTVVLGFLAGLWLAPFVETNLLGVFSTLVILPVGILVTSFGFAQLPDHIRHRFADGWESALLVPVVVLLTYLSFIVSSGIENLFFAGDMRSWITNDLGITYDQRNAMIVGLAMGFAVIPTIFSIAEDAIFTVPRHLSYGSLALGATPWQTMYRVVLPTASPGIFSGVMIGFGRAVGETMIVLMATGNTPIMDINIFEGMRTLAANIAVEVPESEVDSTHYRILFLTALVLFLFTFVFNTLAEIVRQRLRNKYSTI